MPKNFFYSINLLIKSDSHIEKAITAVIDDEKYFSENVQLILIDTVCSEFSTGICSRYSTKYPQNIVFVDAEGKNNADAYNDARALSSGVYIAFIDNYGEYAPKTLPRVQKLLQSGKIPIACIDPLYSVSGDESKNYLVNNITPGVVRLRKTPDLFILMLGCYFYNRSRIARILFDPASGFHSDIKFIAETLLLTYSYIFTNTGCYTTSRACEHEPFRYQPQYNKAFYTRSIKGFMIPLLKSYAGSVIVQSIIMYLINIRFSLNTDEKYKYVLTGNTVDEFFDATAEALNFIDDAVILNKNLYRMCALDEEISFRFICMKYKKPDLRPTVDVVMHDKEEEKSYYNTSNKLVKTTLSGGLVAHINQAVIASSESICADIMAVNYDNDGLYIDACLYDCTCFDDKDITIYADINGTKTPVFRSEVYTITKCFDIQFLNKYAFRFFVPVSGGKNMDTVCMVMKYHGLLFRIGIRFNGMFARLSEMKNSYWRFLDRAMIYNEKTRAIVIRKATPSLTAFCENRFLADISKQLGIAGMLYYRSLRQSVRRNIKNKEGHKQIIFYDEGGINCNGNLLFRYFSKYKRTDKLDVYFTAKKDSLEYGFLHISGYHNLLETGSMRTKAAALSADVIVASDCDIYEALGFSPTDLLYLKDLINAETVSVKNFFMTYNSAQFDNRLRDNTQLVFCAAQAEKKQLLKGSYDYDESMVSLCGYPILDYLTDKKEKLILIAPGDRRQFCIYEHTDLYHFSESRFFKVYHELLTDTHLLTVLRENGYKLALLLPQSVEKYLGLFYSDDTVALYEASEKNEQDLVTRAAMLVTDYSELQYKFAFLNKPVTYYHPFSLPVPSEYKDMKLSQNGFGEIFFDQDKLVSHLTESIINNCPQPENYTSRCKSFFQYTDTDSCGRIYTAITERLF